MNKPILKTVNLSSKSKKKYVYQDINIEIKNGEVVGLLGHNGAGKSTMLRNLANIEIPQEGYVQIAGQKNNVNQFNKDIILIPDVIELDRGLTVKQNLNLIAANYSYDEEFFTKYLEKVKLEHATKVGELSKGNQEILQLIILLSLDAKVILFDEPFSAIDIFRRELIIKMIIDIITKDEKCIIITTHLISEIEQVLTRVLYLDNGNIIINKPMEEIQQESDSLVDYLKEKFSQEVF